MIGNFSGEDLRSRDNDVIQEAEKSKDIHVA